MKKEKVKYTVKPIFVQSFVNAFFYGILVVAGKDKELTGFL